MSNTTASKRPKLTPLDEYELRYLRKAIRWRLFQRDPLAQVVGSRSTPPPRDFPRTNGPTYVVSERRAEVLDRYADWILQEEA